MRITKDQRRVLKHLLTAFPRLRTVVDSHKRVVVGVTEADCSGAQPRAPGSCALAKAACRVLHATGAFIGISYSYIIKDTKAIRFKTSETVAREITSFDRHRDFAPGMYALSKVSESNSLGQERRTRPDNGGTHPRFGQHRVVHSRTARVREVR